MWRVSLQAASFGKCFLTDFSPDQFVTTCRELRVLNAVRDNSVGLPLTHTQYPLSLHRCIMGDAVCGNVSLCSESGAASLVTPL